MDQYTPGIVLVTMNSAMRKQAPRVSLHSKRWSIRKINFSVSTEDEKEKEASSGGWRVKEGSEFTLGCQGSAQSGCEQIRGRGSGRPGEAAPHRGRAKCRGHGEVPKGFRTSKEAGDQSGQEHGVGN